MMSLGACSGDGAGSDRTPEGGRTTEGGLDGGGAIAVGISWTKGIFVQPIWDQGQLRLLVSNRRTQAVSFRVFETTWEEDPNAMVADLPPTRGAELAQATVPPLSTLALDGSTLPGEGQGIWWVAVDDEYLGLIDRPQPPLLAGTLPIVSSETMFQTQLETDFALLPGPSFEAVVTFSQPGLLKIVPASSPSDYVALLSPTAVSSDDAAVTPTVDGFQVELPAETSVDSPARVQLTFDVPSGVLSSEAVIALSAGFFCFEPTTNGGCSSGTQITRFVPAP